MMVSTVQRAQGRWREIMPRLGIDAKFLRNRHGPCPLCGGKDRFRFDDRDGHGTYFCNQCGAGNGIILLRKKHGWDFKQACVEIDGIIGKDYRPPPPKPVDRATPERRRAALAQLLNGAGAQQIVDAHLKRRGLSVTSSVLRGHPACPYYDDESRVLVGRFPAVLAPITAPNGDLVSVQRVYDADVPERKKTMAPVGTIRGAAVRLQAVDGDELGVCEGWATGLAAYELFRIPTWAALNAGNLEVWQPPPGIMKLHVFADNDVNSEGQAAAFNLARRVNRWNRQRKTGADLVVVHLPPTPGADWLDILASWHSS